MQKLNHIWATIIVLAILFFTSKYAWVGNHFVHLVLICMYGYNLQHLNLSDIEIPQEVIKKIAYILFSESSDSNANYSQEFNKSLGRIRDFINITKKDGSGSYPEDFHYRGYERDDGSTIHSKAPADWGIIEYYDFGNYFDLLKRKESAGQAARWLEYDYRVNQRVNVAIATEDTTFNSSGTQWFKDYCKDNNLSHSNVSNNYEIRNNFRAIAASKK